MSGKTKKKQKGVNDENAEVFYLDDPMHVLTHNCVEWHPRKDLKVLSIHNTVCLLACSLPSAGDRSNIILGVPRSNHKERGKFKENVIKKNNLGEEEKYFCLVIVNKNNNKN